MAKNSFEEFKQRRAKGLIKERKKDDGYEMEQTFGTPEGDAFYNNVKAAQRKTLPKSLPAQQKELPAYQNTTIMRKRDAQGKLGRYDDFIARTQSMEKYRNTLENEMYASGGAEKEGLQKRLSILQGRIDTMARTTPMTNKADKNKVYSNEAKIAMQKAESMDGAKSDTAQRIREMEAYKETLGQKSYSMGPNDEIDDVNKKRADITKQMDILQGRIDKMKQSITNTKNAQYYATQAAKRKDFEIAAISTQHSDATDEIETKNAKGKNIINTLETEKYLSSGSNGQGDTYKLAFLSEAEKKTMLTLANKKDFVGVRKYYDAIKRDLNAREQQQNSRETQHIANINKTYGTMGNIAGSFLTPLAYADTVAQNVKNAVTGEYEPIDPNGDMMRGVHLVNDTQAGITKDLGGFGKFIVDTGLSIGQFASKLPFGGAAALGIMATGAAGQTAQNVAERGGTAEQALLAGTTAGLAEYLSEKIPLEQLYKTAKSGISRGARETVKEIFKQSSIEASEEGISEYANQISDIAIMGNKSNFEQYKRELIAQGATPEQAQQKALINFFITQPAMSMAGGAVSGGATGAGAQVANKYTPLGRAARQADNLQNNTALMEAEAQNQQQTRNFESMRAQMHGEAQGEIVSGNAGTEEQTLLQPNGNINAQENGTDFEQLTLSQLPQGQMGAPLAQMLPQNPNAAQALPPKLPYAPGTPQALEMEKTQEIQNNVTLSGMKYQISQADIDSVSTVAKALGRKIEFVEHGNNSNGWYDPKNDTIYIAKDSTNPIQTVFKHELTHTLEGTREFADLVNHVMKSTEISKFVSNNGTTIERLAQLNVELYASHGKKIGYSEGMHEVVADFVGEKLFTSEAEIKKLANENKGVFNTVWKWIKEVKTRLAGTPEEIFLMKTEKLYQKAFDATNKKATQEGGEVKFDFIGTNENNIREYKSGFADDVPMSERIAEFKKRVATIFNFGMVEKKTDVKKIRVMGDAFTFKKNMYGFTSEKNPKMSALYDLADILEHSKYIGKGIEPSYLSKSEKPKNLAHNGVKYWYYFGTDIIFDDVPYNVKFNIRDKGKEQFVYLIEFAKQKDNSHVSDTAANAASRIYTVSYPYDINIPQDKRDVNTKYAQGAEKDTENIKNSIGEGFEGKYKGLIEEYGRKAQENEATPSRKSENHLDKSLRKAADEIAENMSIPRTAKREKILPAVRRLAHEVQSTGKISKENAESVFEQSYEAGVAILDDYYNEYKGLREELRKTRLQISDEDKASIPDFADFRRRNMGRLNIVKENGIPVDVKYMELADAYPGLFSLELTHQADQLMRIAEVRDGIEKTKMSLSQYHGKEAGEFKKYAKEEFSKTLNDIVDEINYVKRYESDNAAKKAKVEMPQADIEAITQAYENDKQLEKDVRKASSKYLFTAADTRKIEKLLAGDIEPQDLVNTPNKKGIIEVFEARKKQQDNMAIVTEYRKNHKRAMFDGMLEIIENAETWKDKNKGLLYSRETAERNMRDITKDKYEAEKINNAIFLPVHTDEARSIRKQNELADKIRKLKLGSSNAYSISYIEPSGKPYSGRVSESALVQLLGEKVINRKQIENCGADFKKIEDAVETFHNVYDELIGLMNDTLIKNGYAPVKYRKDYFPHFEENKPDGILQKIGMMFGIDVNDESLPTDIAGRTHEFKPGKQWLGNAMERKGNETAYDALDGFDRYVNGAANVIYHTDNIQTLRTFEDALRYKFSSDGTKAEIDKVREDKNIDEITRNERLNKLYERDNKNLPNFVTWLRNYTDGLAGKKHPSDRNFEHEIGRKYYTIIKKLENRVAANMVALNPGSWLTNFIPLTQGGSQLKTASMLVAMKDAAINTLRDDGFSMASDFLTSRRGTQALAQSTAEKMSVILAKPMYYIDDFTANTLVRARYMENISNNMNVVDAMQDADRWTAGVMADRSKGALPTIFNKQNPLAKMFTMFQVEVNNQMSYSFKDLPREEREKSVLAVAAALMKFCIGAALYNFVYEKITGRRAALDPIGMIQSAYGDFTNESMKTSEKMGNLTLNIIKELPFVGGVLGGGRLPINSAIPNLGQVAKLGDKDLDKKKKLDIIKKEIVYKPLTYLALPFGGGQVKKIAEAGEAYAKGGSYAISDDGKKQLQFTVNNKSGGGLILGATFGKYALPMAQDYVDSGFKKLSVKNTAIVDAAEAQGIGKQQAVEIINGMKKFDTLRNADGTMLKTEISQKRNYILGLDLEPTQKKWLDEQCFGTSDTRDVDYSSEAALHISEYGISAQEKAQEAKKQGIAEETFLKAFEAIRGLDSDKNLKGETIKLSKDRKQKKALDAALKDLGQYDKYKIYEILGISKKVWYN